MKLYNTLTKKKENIKSIKKNHFKLYVCGITPYAHCHLGHLRTFIIFDTLIRYLKYKKNKITYVQNITDIDDKIIKASKKKKNTYSAITNYYIKENKKNFKKFNLIKPTINPKVTTNINYIIKIIIILFEKKHAYINQMWDICHNLKKKTTYGKLSNRIKNNAISLKNFVLWKKMKRNEPNWESPFGNGRPGWHIECTALSKKYLGLSFDIHGGGVDLIFPHHENELEQSKNLTTKLKINYWLHVGMVQKNKKKLSKTKKNYQTIKQLLKKNSIECLKYFVMNKNYQKPLEVSTKQLIQCNKIIQKFQRIINICSEFTYVTIEKNTHYEKKFLASLENNLDLVTAFCILHKLERDINIEQEKKSNEIKFLKLCKLFKFLINLIGLFLTTKKSTIINSPNYYKKINLLIKKREYEKKYKNWRIADLIRNILKKKYNIEFKDLKTSYQ